MVAGSDARVPHPDPDSNPSSDPDPDLGGEEWTSYPLEELLVPPDPVPLPEDFDDFWRTTFAELGTGSVPARIEARERFGDRDVDTVTFASAAGEPVRAWIVHPVPGVEPRGGVVVGHGYGGREGPEPALVPPDVGAIFPVAPGQPVNRSATIPAPYEEHVLHGIASARGYVIRACVADVWRAGSVLRDAVPATAARLDYRGGSFGGGLGVLALPWDSRFSRAHVDVPTFGHHPLRLTRYSRGSGEAVRRHVAAHPEALEVLRYFDAAAAATRVRIPVHVGAARMDPTVDPRGQFAVFHALAGPAYLTVRETGHAELPVAREDDARVLRDAAEFFALSGRELAARPRGLWRASAP